MVDIEQLRCGTRIKFIAWRDCELQQEAEGTIVKVWNSLPDSAFTGCMGTSSLSNPFFYVRFDNGEGLKISTWDVLEVLDQNKSIPFADECGGVFHQSPDVVTRFFNSLLGR